MKVQELIRELSKCNPEKDVMIITSETGIFEIVKVTEEKNVVYVEGEY